MRKHGWELPYHPLQVVAVAVFLALAFAYYVFFVPFVGRKIFQYIALSLYSPLVALAFSLYIWCAAVDPGDPGVFQSKKYKRPSGTKEVPEINDPLPVSAHDKKSPCHEGLQGNSKDELNREKCEAAAEESLHVNEPANLGKTKTIFKYLLLPCSCALAAHFCTKSDSNRLSSDAEDDVLYCSLCEVEVHKYSKHCRVCDKCVDGFDHHCRWLNNCIGRRNYRGFFVLMVSAFILLVLQWVIGIVVLISCFLNRRHFHTEIISKLGSSFSLVPFIIVVGCCTLLAMVATLPLGQLFFFHILLIKKGISTYDYIIAMRDQEQTIEDGQSPQMSTISSATAMSSLSSFNALHRGAWCTPPRLLFEDQFSVIPPELASISGGAGNRSVKGLKGGKTIQKNSGTVRISPWTLARLNGEELSRAAAQARKKSKILQPIAHHDNAIVEETDSSTDSRRNMVVGNKLRPHHKKRSFRRERHQSPTRSMTLSRASRSSRFPSKHSIKGATVTVAYDESIDVVHPIAKTSGSIAPLQIEARNAFCSNVAVPSGGPFLSSPESSLTSPDIQPFRESTSGKHPATLSGAPLSFSKEVKLWRSTSDGYEPSGGESPDDSDHPSASHHKLSWSTSRFYPVYSENSPITEPYVKHMNIFPSPPIIPRPEGCASEVNAVMGSVVEEACVVEEISFCLSEKDSLDQAAEEHS